MRRLPCGLVVVFAVACGGKAVEIRNGSSGAPSTGGSAVGGSAGTIGSGGVSAGGASAGGVSAGGAGGSVDLTDLCLGQDQRADGSDGLVDDLEDGDSRTRAADHRSGVWWVAAGNGCKVVPDPNSPRPLPVQPPPGDASKYALQVTATGCLTSSWGFQTGLTLNNVGDRACAYDATAYDGVQFWAIGQGVRLLTQVVERATFPVRYGGDGTCDGHTGTDVGCWDHYSVTFGLSGQWALYAFSWSSLAQAGWGTPVPFDVRTLTEIAFQVSPDQATTNVADLAIDDVRFYHGAPDPTPPHAGP